MVGQKKARRAAGIITKMIQVLYNILFFIVVKYFYFFFVSFGLNFYLKDWKNFFTIYFALQIIFEWFSFYTLIMIFLTSFFFKDGKIAGRAVLIAGQPGTGKTAIAMGKVN